MILPLLFLIQSFSADETLPASHQNVCFGYEKSCNKPPFIPKSSSMHQSCKISTTTPERQGNRSVQTLYKMYDLYQDFGYVKKKLDNLHPISSKMNCTNHLRLCTGTDLHIKFKDFKNSGDTYNQDSISQINTICDDDDCNQSVDFKFIKRNNDHKGALQSWGVEFQSFSTVSNPQCDHVFNSNVIMLKIDAGINMYHHFCDFVNLYISQHLIQDFSLDTQIIVWQPGGSYWSYFSDILQKHHVFTRKPTIHLTELSGKNVCFKKQVTFPFLSRQRFGFYYNMPGVFGCKKSSIFKAFSEHVKFRMGLELDIPVDECKVTFLSRGTWRKNGGKYARLVSNEDSLLDHAEKYFPNCTFEKVIFDRSVSFYDQVKKVSKSSLFISMHGSGLTHLLFLADSAKVIELWNCEDRECYKDLANLRGVDYFTWTDILTEKEKDGENFEISGKTLNPQYVAPGIFPIDYKKHPKHPENQKFWNFQFEKKKFIKLLKKAMPEHYYKKPVSVDKVNFEL